MSTNKGNNFIKHHCRNDCQLNFNKNSIDLFANAKGNDMIISNDCNDNLAITFNRLNNTDIKTNANANANQWYAYKEINPSIAPIEYSPYYNNTLFSELLPLNNNFKYSQGLNSNSFSSSELNKQNNQSFPRLPLNHINQYISYQNHFHCYPFPLFNYVPYYPSNFNPKLHSQMNQNSNNHYKLQLDNPSKNTEAIAQIELLFSFSHLNKDVYFRGSMNKNGWMPLNMLMTMISIKKLNIDVEQIVQCLSKSINKTVELKTESNNSYYIRKVNWEEFSKGLLNIDEIKKQKSNKPQNQYLSSDIKNTNNENTKEFAGKF